ncbi:MAG: hypothetical protein QNJ12_02785 [Ilumatobacter sp.]|uniref:hypothetical protein n=1 Tax=Ilumatobacter sp. TaxID=1967498 RepID=UPI002607EE51|nr:hypothetical protein [Ilumatobacter sp.]MDJ0767685.1 hypothetical protein [Ilumatobacter sp.]
MLPRRLTRTAAAALAVASCASVDGTESGALRDAVVEPGLEAIEQADPAACNADASALRTALDVYEVMQGEPAPDEAALVAEEYLRDESTLWDVRDGALVPADPGCGVVPADIPEAEIVTSTEPLQNADEIYAEFSAADVDLVGGPDCARELAVIYAGVERFAAERGEGPGALEELDGFLDQPVGRWQTADDRLVPVAGSGCVDPTVAEFTSACRASARTLVVAREAYIAKFPGAAEPTEQDLVDAGLLGKLDERLDLVDGAPAAVAGSECAGIDLTPPRDTDGDSVAIEEECTRSRRTMEVAIEAYLIEHDGALPATEADLIGFLRAELELVDITADGSVIPAPGSICDGMW